MPRRLLSTFFACVLCAGLVHAQAGRELTKAVMESSSFTLNLQGIIQWRGGTCAPSSTLCDAAAEARQAWVCTDSGNRGVIYTCPAGDGWVKNDIGSGGGGGGSAPDPNRMVYVCNQNCDAATICGATQATGTADCAGGSGIALAKALSPACSTTNPCGIWIAPGVYDEKVVFKDFGGGVTVYADGALIKPTSSTLNPGTLVIGPSGSTTLIDDLTIRGGRWEIGSSTPVSTTALSSLKCAVMLGGASNSDQPIDPNTGTYRIAPYTRVTLDGIEAKGNAGDLCGHGPDADADPNTEYPALIVKNSRFTGKTANVLLLGSAGITWENNYVHSSGATPSGWGQLATLMFTKTWADTSAGGADQKAFLRATGSHWFMDITSNLPDDSTTSGTAGGFAALRFPLMPGGGISCVGCSAIVHINSATSIDPNMTAGGGAEWGSGAVVINGQNNGSMGYTYQFLWDGYVSIVNNSDSDARYGGFVSRERSGGHFSPMACTFRGVVDVKERVGSFTGISMDIEAAGTACGGSTGGIDSSGLISTRVHGPVIPTEKEGGAYTNLWRWGLGIGADEGTKHTTARPILNVVGEGLTFAVDADPNNERANLTANDATGSTRGDIMLAGDLSGTASSPQVVDNSHGHSALVVPSKAFLSEHGRVLTVALSGVCQEVCVSLPAGATVDRIAYDITASTASDATTGSIALYSAGGGTRYLSCPNLDMRTAADQLISALNTTCDAASSTLTLAPGDYRWRICADNSGTVTIAAGEAGFAGKQACRQQVACSGGTCEAPPATLSAPNHNAVAAPIISAYTNSP
jgi:hypothetical protein